MERERGMLQGNRRMFKAEQSKKMILLLYSKSFSMSVSTKNNESVESECCGGSRDTS